MEGIITWAYRYEASPSAPLFEPPKPKISKLFSSNFCPEGTAVLDNYRVAGFACFGGANNSNLIAYENATFVETDCLHVEEGNGNWTSYTCEDAASIYMGNGTSLGTMDHNVLLAMVSSTCCDIEKLDENPKSPTNDEIREFWWNVVAVKEFREGHSKNWILIKSVLSIISVIASSIFIWMILRSHDGISTTQNRLLGGLCISDILYTVPQSLFGVMVPKEQDYMVWNARGNMASCQINGLIIAFGGQLGPLYNASLCIYYLAIVKYEKSDEFIRTKIEPYLHAIPVVVSFINAFLNFAKDSINIYRSGTCGYSINDPPHCIGYDDGSVVMEGLFDIPCGRGREFFNYSFILSSSLILLPTLIILGSLTMIYRSIRCLENKISRYGHGSLHSLRAENINTSHGTDNSSSRTSIANKVQAFARNIRSSKKSKQKKKSKHSRSVLFKGVAYSCSLFLTWAFYFPALFVIYFSDKNPIFLVYMAIIFTPLQGVYNLAIFMHPKILSAKRSKRDNLSWRQAFVKAFWSKGKDKKTAGRNRQHNPPSTLRNRKKIKLDDIQNSKYTNKTNSQIRSSVPSESTTVARKPDVPQDVTHLSLGNYAHSKAFDGDIQKDYQDSSTTHANAEPYSRDICLGTVADIDDDEDKKKSSPDHNVNDEKSSINPDLLLSERRMIGECCMEDASTNESNDEENR